MNEISQVQHNPLSKSRLRDLETLTGVVAVDLIGSRSSAVGQNLAVLANVDNGGSRNTDSATASRSGLGVGKDELTKVGKGHKTAAGLEVLHNPLGIGLAQARRLATERMAGGLAGGQVFNGSLSSCLRGGRDGHSDGITSRNSKSSECIRVCIGERLEAQL